MNRDSPDLEALFRRHDGAREYLCAFGGHFASMTLNDAIKECRAAAHYLTLGAIVRAGNGGGDFMVVDVLGTRHGVVAFADHDVDLPVIVAPDAGPRSTLALGGSCARGLVKRACSSLRDEVLA